MIPISAICIDIDYAGAGCRDRNRVVKTSHPVHRLQLSWGHLNGRRCQSGCGGKSVRVRSTGPTSILSPADRMERWLRSHRPGSMVVTSEPSSPLVAVHLTGGKGSREPCYEGLLRLMRMVALRICVSTSQRQTAANRLYESAGFCVSMTCRTWTQMD